MSDEEKESLLRKLYEEELLSWPAIAEKVGTYTNRVSRDAKKFGIITRNKAEAQKIALDTERIQHPTKGKKRTAKEKAKIGKAVLEKWDSLPEHEKARRAEISKERWHSMSLQEREEFRQASIEAIRKTIVDGSKLENFIHKGLIKAGHKVDFHVKRFVKNEQLEIDMFIKELGIAIEVDGPSHWEPIWGHERFDKTVVADRLKNGLLIGSGYTVIRVQGKEKRISLTYQNRLLSSLLDKIEDIKSGKCTDRLIYIV
jgi:very-short-patch-repair endonuclease